MIDGLQVDIEKLLCGVGNHDAIEVVDHLLGEATDDARLAHAGRHLADEALGPDVDGAQVLTGRHLLHEDELSEPGDDGRLRLVELPTELDEAGIEDGFGRLPGSSGIVGPVVDGFLGDLARGEGAASDDPHLADTLGEGDRVLELLGLLGLLGVLLLALGLLHQGDELSFTGTLAVCKDGIEVVLRSTAQILVDEVMEAPLLSDEIVLSSVGCGGLTLEELHGLVVLLGTVREDVIVEREDAAGKALLAGMVAHAEGSRDMLGPKLRGVVMPVELIPVGRGGVAIGIVSIVRASGILGLLDGAEGRIVGHSGIAGLVVSGDGHGHLAGSLLALDLFDHDRVPVLRDAEQGTVVIVQGLNEGADAALAVPSRVLASGLAAVLAEAEVFVDDWGT